MEFKYVGDGSSEREVWGRGYLSVCLLAKSSPCPHMFELLRYFRI